MQSQKSKAIQPADIMTDNDNHTIYFNCATLIQKLLSYCTPHPKTNQREKHNQSVRVHVRVSKSDKDIWRKF